MAEQGGAALTDREQRIWHEYAVRRRTQTEIAEQFEITQPRVSQILAEIKAKMPPPDLSAMRAEVLEMLNENYRRATKLIEMEGAPVTSGKDGAVVYDPESNAVVRDYSGRLAAMKLLNDTAAHARKMLGLDAAEKIELGGTVRYELVGVDPEDLK